MKQYNIKKKLSLKSFRNINIIISDTVLFQMKKMTNNIAKLALVNKPNLIQKIINTNKF